jgi:CRP/FNR family cyclic AMP-dependent transcriptional regulator
MAGCGENVVFPAGTVIASEGSEADYFYLLRRGRVALELHCLSVGGGACPDPGRRRHSRLVLAVSPLPLVRGARAVQDVRAIRVDGKCLRGKCDADPVMGYALMQSFSRLMIQRVEATRLQLLDLYGQGDAS